MPWPAGADVAIGSRALRAEGVRVEAKLYRHLIGRTFHQMVKWLADAGVNDTQCGFKLFRSSVAQDLFSRMRMNGFSFDVELLVIARRRGYQVAEVPVELGSPTGLQGAVNVGLAQDGGRSLSDPNPLAQG